MDGVADDGADVLVVVGGAGFVTGLEVEELAVAPVPQAAGAEYLAAAEAAQEYQLIGGGNVEEFTVHFFLPKINAFRHIPGNGMTGIDAPKLFFVALPPAQGAGGAKQLPHGLAQVTGVEDDEAHAPAHMVTDPGGDFVGNVLMGDVPPPEQHVGVLKHLLTEAALLHLQGGDVANLNVGILLHKGLQGALDTLWVDGADSAGIGGDALPVLRGALPVAKEGETLTVQLFLNKFIPNRYFDHIVHPKNFVQMADTKNTRISAGSRFSTLRSRLMPVSRRPAHRVMIPPAAEKSAIISGVMKGCIRPETKNSTRYTQLGNAQDRYDLSENGAEDAGGDTVQNRLGNENAAVTGQTFVESTVPACAAAAEKHYHSADLNEKCFIRMGTAQELAHDSADTAVDTAFQVEKLPCQTAQQNGKYNSGQGMYAHDQDNSHGDGGNSENIVQRVFDVLPDPGSQQNAKNGPGKGGADICDDSKWHRIPPLKVIRLRFRGGQTNCCLHVR